MRAAHSSIAAARLALAFALLSAVVVAGCHFNEPPDLLTVHRLDPARASGGDRLTLTGEGFPEGRPATVAFRGDLHRPGKAPERDVRITLPAVPAARNTVVVAFDALAERRFLGSGAGVLHTTFRGDVKVAFVPAASGRTAVSGTARNVRFDVLPASPGPRAAEELAEGHSTLGFLGLAALPEATGRGLSVTGVDPEGRAASLGLVPGDLIVELDGLTVLSEGDLRVRSGESTARLSLERAGRLLPALDVDVDGLAPYGLSDVVGPAALLLLACALLVLPVTRTGLVIRWIVRQVEVERAKIGRSGTRHGRLARWAAALLPREDSGRTGLAAATLLLAGILSGTAWLALGHPLFGQDVDLAALALLPTLLLVVARLVDSGLQSGARSWSLGRALASAGRTVLCALPPLIAIFGAVLASGRFVIGEMLSEQGGAPWRWAAFRNPGLFALSALLLFSIVPESDDCPGLPPVEGLPSRVEPRSVAIRAAVRLSEWSYVWTFSALAVMVFFGGSRVPGLSSMVQETKPAFVGAGLAILAVKVATVALAVGAVRTTVARLAIEHVASVATRRLVPAALVALAVGASWAAALESADSRVLADIAGYLAVALVVAVPLGITAVLGRSAPPVAASVNPWL